MNVGIRKLLLPTGEMLRLQAMECSNRKMHREAAIFTKHADRVNAGLAFLQDDGTENMADTTDDVHILDISGVG